MVRPQLAGHWELEAFQIHFSFLAYLVGKLVERSCWFSVEPLPDDQYEIQVKAEQGEFVRSIIADTD